MIETEAGSRKGLAYGLGLGAWVALPAPLSATERAAPSLQPTPFNTPTPSRHPLHGAGCRLVVADHGQVAFALPQSRLRDTAQVSGGKSNPLHHTPAGFTAVFLGGYGLCCLMSARPDATASLSGSCLSGRGFAPRSLPWPDRQDRQTPPHGEALALR